MIIDNPFINAIFNVLIPSFIIFAFSGENYLGPNFSFLIALIFPLLYGIYYLLRKSKWNLFSLIGILSVLLTGGFGLFEFDSGWLIAKETGIPLIFGIIIIFSQVFNKPFMRIMLNQILDTDKIILDYKKNSKEKLFYKHVNLANLLFGITFFIGSLLNFLLSTFILRSPPGTTEYAREVGKMSALAFPAIVLPVMVFMFCIFTMIALLIEKNTGKLINDYMN